MTDAKSGARPIQPTRRCAAAFNAHQTTDKGFGPSAGPDATCVMSQLFEKAGYRVALGDSPWEIGPATAPWPPP